MLVDVINISSFYRVDATKALGCRVSYEWRYNF